MISNAAVAALWEEQVGIARRITPDLSASGVQDPLVGTIQRGETLRIFATTRLSRVPDVEGVAASDRALLTDRTLDALESMWPEFEAQIPDPLSTPAQNTEARRRLPWLAIEVAARVLNKVLQTAASMQSRSTFSSAATTSRLAGTLTYLLETELDLHALRAIALGETHAASNSLQATQPLFLHPEEGVRVLAPFDPAVIAHGPLERARLAERTTMPTPLVELKAELQTMLQGARRVVHKIDRQTRQQQQPQHPDGHRPRRTHVAKSVSAVANHHDEPAFSVKHAVATLTAVMQPTSSEDADKWRKKSPAGAAEDAGNAQIRPRRPRAKSLPNVATPLAFAQEHQVRHFSRQK